MTMNSVDSNTLRVLDTEIARLRSNIEAMKDNVRIEERGLQALIGFRSKLAVSESKEDSSTTLSLPLSNTNEKWLPERGDLVNAILSLIKDKGQARVSELSNSLGGDQQYKRRVYTAIRRLEERGRITRISEKNASGEDRTRDTSYRLS